MFLQQGDQGKDVSKTQKFLSLLGYDLVIDGHYGPKTARSVRSFQKKYNLTRDGIIGSNTWEALKAAQKRTSKEINNASEKSYDLNIIKHHLDSEQYIKQIFDKKQIYIHFTAGNENAKNAIDWWDSNEPRIATAFVIDRNTGDIYEAHNPDYWSFHLGVKGTRGKLDKHSIGIELCNWGPLKYRDGNYYKWPDNYSKYTLPEEEVYKLEKFHRGHKYYQSYSEEQLQSLEKLLIYLINKYNIRIDHQNFDNSWYEYQDHVIKDQTEGIWTHVNVRKDKSDSYPDSRLTEMLNNLKNKI